MMPARRNATEGVSPGSPSVILRPDPPPARMIHAPAGSIGPKIRMGYARWPSTEIKFLRE